VPPEAHAARLSFSALQQDLPRRSPRAWRFAALAAGSRAGALLSDGLRIGHKHGFDSGPFMAHVYADRPSGRTPLGRALDRRLLRRPTCQAFREIGGLAEEALEAAIDAHPGGEPLCADLAAGPSPYVLRALWKRRRARALLCDIDTDALRQASAAAVAAGMADRVQTRRADAFDRAALEQLDPKPDIVLELGLYGIYHDDALIERHFLDVAELLDPEQVVFNVQVANPEIEYIARVWRDHRGGRCLWRLRPLEQILGYAAAAGYEPATVTADTNAIYRVVRLVRQQEAA
jgi:hypothetical protein